MTEISIQALPVSGCCNEQPPSSTAGVYTKMREAFIGLSQLLCYTFGAVDHQNGQAWQEMCTSDERAT